MFSDVTTYMCTEKAVSVSEVLPIVCGLINDHLHASEEDRPTVSKVKGVIREDLQCRYKLTSASTAGTVSALATLLDPWYKKLQIFTSSQRSNQGSSGVSPEAS